MTSTLTEADLQKQVVDWLKIALPPGCVFHHSPNEGKRHVAFKKKLKTMGTQSGWPDLEIFIPGDQAVHSISTSVFIELKRPGGKPRMSGTQLEMAQRLILAGCHYGMAQSLGEVFDILDPLVRLKAGT